MPSVVFTGQAIDAQGNFVLRADLASAAKKAGWTVWDQMHYTTDLLVASRLDTVKAKKAISYGVAVKTYPDFIASLGEVPTADQSQAKANAYTDPGAVAQIQQLTAAQKHEQAVAPFLGRGRLL
jgi:hypothetical protein